MKSMIIIFTFILPIAVFPQVTLKAGFTLGNRWNESLNSQTLGKGFRVDAEKNILPQLTIGVEVSYISFNPNNYVNVRYNAYSLLAAYYFNTKKLQPFTGVAFGYNNYSDNTNIDLGGGNISKQSRDKSYGNISPFLGLRYHVDKKNKAAVYLQANADFVPIMDIDPIGFVSVTGGITYRL